MIKVVLKQNILEKIKQNPVLAGEVCGALNIKISSLAKLLRQNDPKLTQAGVLFTLRKNIKGLKNSDILETPQLVLEKF